MTPSQAAQHILAGDAFVEASIEVADQMYVETIRRLIDALNTAVEAINRIED